MFELRPRPRPARRLVRLAETLSEDLAHPRRRVHDRDSYVTPTRASTRSSEAGYFTAPIPVEHGGLGVASVHDLVVASSRLARGDASVAIGVNMHLVAAARTSYAAADRRTPPVTSGAARAFGALARGRSFRDGVVMAAAISERSQDLTRPQRTATRTQDGWRIDGRKAFCTMSPAATVLLTAVTYVDDDGERALRLRRSSRTDTPGVEILGDWDALGMRASGSHSVMLRRRASCRRGALRGGFAVGDAAAFMERNLSAGLFHAVGVARASPRRRVGHRARRARAARGEPRRAARRCSIAENAIELGACRATIAPRGVADRRAARGATRRPTRPTRT